jgi:hypothetical protein
MNVTSDRADRLKWARARAGFDSPRAAARHHRWNENTYKAREGGLRDYSPEDAVVYGRAFAVWWGWLLLGEGDPDRRRNVVPVVGRVGEGGVIEPAESQVPAGGLFEITLPFSPPDDAIALECATGSWPRYEAGDVVICRSVSPPAEGVVGQEVAARTVDGARYLRRIIRGAKSGTYDLEAFTGQPPLRNARIDWIGPVEAIVRRGRWHRVDAGFGDPDGAVLRTPAAAE